MLLMPDAKIIEIHEVIERQKLGPSRSCSARFCSWPCSWMGSKRRRRALPAPAIIKDWGIPRSSMGLVFGAGNLA